MLPFVVSLPSTVLGTADQQVLLCSQTEAALQLRQGTVSNITANLTAHLST